MQPKKNERIPKKRIIILIVTVFVAAFIFVQSMLPKSVSARESDWVTDRVLNPALAVFGLGPFTYNAVRKTAHVAEFFLLELLLVFCFRGRTAVAFGTGYLAAFLDESIQLLSDRGAMIADVWIDLIGVSAGLLLGVVLLRGITADRRTGHVIRRRMV